MNRAFVLASGSSIDPFGDPPSDAWIVDRRLGDLQRDVLRDCGITEVAVISDLSLLPSGGAPFLVLGDDLFVTRALLRDFLAALQRDAGNASVRRLALPDSRILTESAPLQDLVRGTGSDGKGWAGYPLWIAHFGVTREDLEGAAPLVIDPREETKSLKGVPKVFAETGELSFAFTARVAMRVQHWVHVLKANHLAMMAGIAELKDRSKLRNALAIFWIALKSFPPNEARVMRALVQRGKGVKIHPSAVVEASILGDGVKIGAHAVVRGSVLGANVTVGDFAYVQMSVLGPGAVVTKRATAEFAVLYPEAVLGHYAQMSVLGRAAFVATEAILLDMKGKGDVPVEHRGAQVSSGQRFLGACIGHGAFVGAGVFLRHGIAVPNGASLVKHPEEIVGAILPAADGKPCVVRDGKAVPLTRATGTGES